MGSPEDVEVRKVPYSRIVSRLIFGQIQLKSLRYDIDIAEFEKLAVSEHHGLENIDLEGCNRLMNCKYESANSSSSPYLLCQKSLGQVAIAVMDV